MRPRAVAVPAVLLIAGALLIGVAPQAAAQATIERMEMGIPRIVGATDAEVLEALGRVHATDRLFQMDVQRRLFSGRLAELVGEAALAQDVELRTLGLRRAAVASLDAVSDDARVWLEAYADGVNAVLADESVPLPPEYAALELSRASIPPWTAVDSLTLAKGLAFGLSFDLSDLGYTQAFLTLQAAGAQAGFDGVAMFTEDLYRSAPFDPAVSIPDFTPGQKTGAMASGELPRGYLDASTLRLVEGYRERVQDIPLLARTLERSPENAGSNWWLVGGDLSASGYPMLANDPHLALDQPSVFYEVRLEVTDATEPMTAFGVSFPGTPVIAQGCTPSVCWGSTVNPMDVTDVFQERIALSTSDQLPIGALVDGHWQVIRRIKQRFMVNGIGDGVMDTLGEAEVPADQGGITFVIPGRNHGPILSVDISDITNLTALSVQYTGWGPTREVDAFRIWARADDLDDFRNGLQYFDFGSQNWGYADTAGNIAYFTSAENPIREDLQTLNAPDGGVPPWFVRDGTGQLAHRWMPMENPQPGQAVPYEIMPAAEMPHEVNPERGYILNANNDPIGTSLDNNPLNQLRPGGGLYYLSPGYAAGFRMGRLQRLFDAAIAAGGDLTADDLKAFQANNQLLDAEFFVPYIVAAYDAMFPSDQVPGFFNQNLTAAVDRLRDWDFSTPTGIPEGFDPGDDPAALPQPDQAEIDASIAATVYSAWRGEIVKLVVDAPLQGVGLGSVAPGSSQAMTAVRNLVETFDERQGVGVSGFPFIQGGDLDGTLMTALSQALDHLAGAPFQAAFGGSTDLEDYRWGRLHRIVFDHPLGGPFSLPPGGGLADVAPDLPGVARSGGFGALDASSHSARADGHNDFMFGSGPARRFVGHLTPSVVEVYQTTPGGVSGLPGHPNQADLLRLWLTNRYLTHTLE